MTLKDNNNNPLRKFLDKYDKFVKFDKKKHRKVGMITLVCTFGTVFVIGAEPSNNIIEPAEAYAVTSYGEIEGIPMVLNENPELRATPLSQSDLVTYQSGVIESYYEDGNTTDEIEIPEDFTVGSAYDSMAAKMDNRDMEPFYEYAGMYGVDPDLVIALACQESSLNHDKHIPGSESYNGGAIGICQIARIDRTIYAHNYYTGMEDEMELNTDVLSDYESNIKASCMMLQNTLDTFYGNVYLAIQAYNYGEGAVKMAVSLYANQIGVSEVEVMRNYVDDGWMWYIRDIHSNPSKYFNWSDGTYGDAYYINNVLRYYNGTDCNVIYAGEHYSFNFIDNSFINLDEQAKMY